MKPKLAAAIAAALRCLLPVLAATILWPVAAAAQDWPAKPIRAIVPLTAGSATDTIGRTVLDQLSYQLGQPIVVENRPGAGNTIGMAAAARSDPDGYTILINSSSHTIVPATYRNLPFDTLRDFSPSFRLATCRRCSWSQRRRVTGTCPTSSPPRRPGRER